jgi:hypothetical protein
MPFQKSSASERATTKEQSDVCVTSKAAEKKELNLFDWCVAGLAQHAWTSILLFLLALVFLIGGLHIDNSMLVDCPEWFRLSFRCLISLCLLLPVLLGISVLAKWFALKRAEYLLYPQVLAATIGYWVWVPSTMFCALLGFVAFMSGVSPLAGAVGVFSIAFAAMAIVLEDRPQRGSSLESLTPFRRIATWQLIVAGAVTAMEYQPPRPGESFASILGINHATMFGLLLAWAFSAGLFIVLLEPLRHRLTAMSRLERRLWQRHHRDRRARPPLQHPAPEQNQPTHAPQL